MLDGWVDGEISNFFHLLYYICLEGGICRYDAAGDCWSGYN